ADRRNFPFEQPIDAEWREEGIAQPADVKEIRREAQALLRERAVSGLRQNRPGFRSASDPFRYNRAEGPAVGFGWGVRPIGASGRLNAGWAFGPGHPLAHARLTTESAWPVTLEAYANRMGDVGGSTPSSRAANTIGSLLFA